MTSTVLFFFCTLPIAMTSAAANENIQTLMSFRSAEERDMLSAALACSVTEFKELYRFFLENDVRKAQNEYEITSKIHSLISSRTATQKARLSATSSADEFRTLFQSFLSEAEEAELARIIDYPTTAGGRGLVRQTDNLGLKLNLRRSIIKAIDRRQQKDPAMRLKLNLDLKDDQSNKKISRRSARGHRPVMRLGWD